MNDNYKVSIIIPVYNAEKYLTRCINSIVNQSLSEIEIICINDGSSDSSEEILKEFQNRDCRIKIINKKNSGVAASRNTGLQIASGEYIAFCDDDDYIDKDALKLVYERANYDHADICLYSTDLYDYKTGQTIHSDYSLKKDYLPKKRPFSPEDESETLFQLTSPNIWTKLFKRSFILENGISFPDFRAADDLVFSYLALTKASLITYVDRELYHYQINIPTSGTVTFLSKSLEPFDSRIQLINDLKKDGLYDLYERSLTNNFLSESIRLLYTAPNVEVFETYYKKIRNDVFSITKFELRNVSYFYDKWIYQACYVVYKNDFENYYNESILNYLRKIIDLKSIEESRTYQIGLIITKIPKKIRSLKNQLFNLLIKESIEIKRKN